MNTLAVVLEKPEQLVLSRLDLTPATDEDVTVDIEWSGISTGTERLLWSGRMPTFPGMGYPLVPGYESVGRVSAAGSRSGGKVGERVFVPGRKNPIVLRSNSSALFLLQRLRDEAHRSANGFHRRRRDGARLRSPLDAIGGIGPQRRRALLRQFGSVRGLRAASIDDLTMVAGITPRLAARIKAHLDVVES